ncbi:BZ3500_MvSof-1268-A1-R1_Chr8-1g09973 [Microbotryum saponariae]|uniref:BZ3500_MvSof-1268-A1-R1_Chr8-1g09973 protein n=1 Tax=Microbotryum saponariae TaxID=289078 RepID=A0A2X0MU21_9BASI|nr:BZ3500_MvSof-1268-A1-R1_Chr8-1g09973 [Microbotryum saponariae]SDA08259.1 BZ3501_MvSof-1269-A2-R1_Chr8-1g09696 [Microbotryum saponariae]
MTSLLDITVLYTLLDTIIPKPLSSSSQTGVPSIVVTKASSQRQGSSTPVCVRPMFTSNQRPFSSNPKLYI